VTSLARHPLGLPAALSTLDRCLVMGVLNVTPDSFSDGGRWIDAEAATEHVFLQMRRELGLPDDRGVRFAWGFGALPDVEEHRKVFDLLPAEKDLGMSLTSAGQLIPEQSTATLLVHHPAAHYFKV
jgi:hypothetical protein